MTKPTYEDLLEREDLYRLVLENILDPVFITDNEGNFTFICTNVRQILGYSPEEMAAVGNIFTYMDRSSFKIDDLDKTASIGNIDTVLVHKNGAKRDYLLTVKKVSIKGGSILYIFHDVTELKQAQNQFRTIFNSAAIAMAIVDLQGNFTIVNDAVIEMLGYSRKELLSMNFQDITHQDDLESSILNYNKLLKDEVKKYRLEKRYIHKNGDTLWGILDVSMTRDERNNPLYSIAQLQDITKHKQNEKKFLDGEKRFKTFFNNSFQFAIILDPQGDVLEMNDVCLEVCGQYAEGFIGKPFWEVAWWNQFPDVQEKTKVAIEMASGGDFYTDEVTFIDKDDKLHHGARIFSPIVDDEGRVSLITVVGLDITKRKQAEDNLKEYKDKLEDKIAERTQDLQTIINAMARREKRIIELKEVIKKLHRQLKDAGMKPVAEDPINKFL